MSFEHEALSDLSPIIVDCESAPLPNAREYIAPPDLDDIAAPKSYVKPKTIAEYIARERASRLADYEQDCTSKAALDWNVARIVALGWWYSRCGDDTPIVRVCESERYEAVWLAEFWMEARHRTIVGFCIRTFDLPLLIQRSRYLNVPHPPLDLGRYARGSHIVDLHDLLTFNDAHSTHVMPRTVRNFARRFGIPVTDPITGEDVPRLIAEGNWKAVVDHCRSDVELELALARRLGVVPQPVTTEEPVL